MKRNVSTTVVAVAVAAVVVVEVVPCDKETILGRFAPGPSTSLIFTPAEDTDEDAAAAAEGDGSAAAAVAASCISLAGNSIIEVVYT